MKIKFRIKVQDLLASYKHHLGSPVFLCDFIKDIYLPNKSIWYELYLSFRPSNNSPLVDLVKQFNGTPASMMEFAFTDHPDFKDLKFSKMLSLRKYNRIQFLERVLEINPNATITARF